MNIVIPSYEIYNTVHSQAYAYKELIKKDKKYLSYIKKELLNNLYEEFSKINTNEDGSFNDYMLSNITIDEWEGSEDYKYASPDQISLVANAYVLKYKNVTVGVIKSI